MTDNHARFLLVDDEPSHRLILKEIIKELWAFEGDILEAATGQEAISMYQQWRPRLILMDLKMPGMNGFEAIHQIRLLESCYSEAHFVDAVQIQTQIIVVSALVTESDRTQAFASGCNGFVKKPYSLHELLETISRHYFCKIPLLNEEMKLCDLRLKNHNAGWCSAPHHPTLCLQL